MRVRGLALLAPMGVLLVLAPAAAAGPLIPKTPDVQLPQATPAPVNNAAGPVVNSVNQVKNQATSTVNSAILNFLVAVVTS